MMGKFEYKGYWYLPSKPDKRVPGTLTYSFNEPIILELIGNFGETGYEVLDHIQGDEIEVIWGETSDAKKISLLKCFPTTISKNLSSSFSLSSYRIQYCLVGIYTDDLSNKRINSCDVSIPALSEWCPPCMITTKYFFEKKYKPDQISISINLKELEHPIVSTGVTQTTTLELRRGIKYQGTNGSLKPRFEQETFLKILKTDKSSIPEFLSDIRQFEDFISLASLSTIKSSKISLFDDTLYQQVRDGKKILSPIELYYTQHKAKVAPQKKLDFLFKYSQIKDLYTNTITRWFNESDEIFPIRTHLLRSLEDKPVFNSTDFLIIIQAIDGFCIRFRKEQCLAKQLKDIIFEFKDIESVKRLDIDIKAVVDSRHYYSHFMKKTKKPRALSGHDLYNLTQKLRVVLICCILDYINISHERIEEILKKSNNRRL